MQSFVVPQLLAKDSRGYSLLPAFAEIFQISKLSIFIKNSPHMQIIPRPSRYMIVFNNVESKVQDMKQKNKTVSTLLVPESLLKSFLENRKEKHKGNTLAYLRNLLSLYRVLTYSGMIPAPSKIKTEYQVENLNLKRITFRPDNASWIELGELALASGKSRCWIFTFLLELDLCGFSEILLNFFKSPSVPTTPDLELKSIWTLQPHFHDFARFFHVRV